MAHYQLQLIYGDKVVTRPKVAWAPEDGPHPVVGLTIDGKWRIVEVLDSTAQVYRVRVEPLAFLVEIRLTGPRNSLGVKLI